MVNKCFLIGMTGKDCEVRSTQGGTEVAVFSLATTKRWKKGDGFEERTNWHNIVKWNPSETVKNIKKGQKVWVEGEIEYRNYEDKEGQKKYVTEINAYTVLVMSKKDAGVEPDVPF